MIELSFAVSALVVCVVVVLFLRMQKWNFLNPHTYHSLWFLLLLIVFPCFQLAVTDVFGDGAGMVKTNIMALLYYISFSIPFFFSNRITFSKKNSWWNVSPSPICTKVVLAVLLLGTIVSYLLLAKFSGFGLVNWLLYPRLGLQFYRGGLGPLFVGGLLCLATAHLWTLFFLAKSGRSVWGCVLFFAFFAYFFGSKGGIIYIAFAGIVFYHYFLKPLSIISLVGLFLVFFMLFSGLLQLHQWQWNEFKQNIATFPTPHYLNFQIEDYYLDKKGVDNETDKEPDEVTEKKENSLMVTVRYATHYNYARLFFRDFGDLFHCVYGAEYVNNLWNYVPRMMCKDKPFSIGLTEYIVEKYHPGLAEKGHGKVVGGKVFRHGVEGFLNFGIVGLVVVGLLKGCFSVFIYNLFLARRGFVEFGILLYVMDYVWFSCPNGLLLVWLILFVSVLKLYSFVEEKKSGNLEGVSSD